MPASPNARSRVLFGRRNRDPSDLALQLVGHEPSTRARPIARAELEHSIPRPVRDDLNHLAQVQLGVEPVQSATRDQREQVRRRVRVVVAAAEQPVLPPDRDAPKPALGSVVRHHQATVVEKAPQRCLMTQRISKRRAHEAALSRRGLQLLAPLHEHVDQRTQRRIALLFSLRRSEFCKLPLDREKRVDSLKTIDAEGAPAHHGFPELASSMAPAANFFQR